MAVKAVIAGAATYRSPHIRDLPAVATDLRRIRSLFEGCEIEVLDELVDPGRTRLLTTFRRACQVTGAADDLILYFSGHGQAWRGEDYLVPADAVIDDVEILDEVLVPVDLGGAIQASRAASVTLLIDACREGVELDTKSTDFTTWRVRRIEGKTVAVAALYSCTHGSYSRVISAEYGSLFTASLCEAVSDRDYGEGTIESVATAVQRYVTANAERFRLAPQTIVLQAARAQDGRPLRPIFPDGKRLLERGTAGAESGRHPPCDFLWPRYSGVYEAWAAGHRGAGVTIALIDQAVYAAHIELRHCRLSQHGVGDVPTPCEAAAGLPPAGAAADQRGDLFAHAEAWQRYEKLFRGRGSGGHATALAGVVCGTNVGVAPEAELVNFSVYRPQATLTDTFTLLQALAEALRLAGERQRTIVLLTSGGPAPNRALQEVVAAFARDDLLLVATAGNAPERGVCYPARWPQALSVGAVSRALAVEPFCDYRAHGHPEPDVYGLGTGLFPSPTGPFDYAPGRGTSFAAAYVAGIAALLWSAEPGLTAGDLRTRLLKRAAGGRAARPGWRWPTGVAETEAGRQPKVRPSSKTISTSRLPSE